MEGPLRFFAFFELLRSWPNSVLPLRLCVTFFCAAGRLGARPYRVLSMASAMEAATVKSAGVKMMKTEVVAVEMMPSVVMVVMPPAKDIVAATVWSPTAVIGSIVRTSGIASGNISALTSG